jgi:hypothetical protein
MKPWQDSKEKREKRKQQDSVKNGDFNQRAQFQRRKELKQENERIRSLAAPSPMFPVNDL